MAQSSPFTLKYQAISGTTSPATGVYTTLTCVTAATPPKRKRGEIRVKCLTSAEDDVEAGNLMTEPGSFKLKWVADGDVEDMDALVASGVSKQWCFLYADSTVELFDAFISSAKADDPERNKAKEVEYEWTVTQYYGRLDAHPS